MWLPMKLLGAKPFREALDEKLQLARAACKAIEESEVPDLVIVVPPELSIFAFKLAPPGVVGGALDTLNVQFLETVHERGNVLLSPFRSIDGRAGGLSLRMAVLSHRTDKAIVNQAVQDIVASAKAVMDGAN